LQAVILRRKRCDVFAQLMAAMPSCRRVIKTYAFPSSDTLDVF
jgi:hypothetical protein